MVSDVSVHHHHVDMAVQKDLKVQLHGLPAAAGDGVHSGYTMSI